MNSKVLRTLVIISTKDPSELLFRQIEQVKKFIPNAYILIVDSDSDDTTYSNRLPPEVELALIRNRGYEWGAYKYGYTKYSNFDRYVCIQDTLLLQDAPDLNQLYTFKHKVGFLNDKQSYKYAYSMLKDNMLLQLCKDSKALPFDICAHNSFIVSSKIMSQMVKDLSFSPKCKLESRAMERILGLWKKKSKIITRDLAKITEKNHGLRGDISTI